ncbi:YhgE/Pip family protein [Clostridium sp.]|jgi:putative membrane protein|uniref:YhgE/Pip family protein n=1 Tax=Clostridium sp. TaxID=1506 RepID=UPI003A5BD17B
MKTRFLKIFKRDMKSIVKNKMALLIVTGVCILPSLYAWVNIKACWSPYENTKDIPVAVVNEDKGATFRGKDVNAGKDIVDKLKENDKIGWKFVNSENADMGIIDGTYYAEIKIPEDFSEDLTTIDSDNPKKPEIIYKVDTKNTPVAVKIADVTKINISNEIKTNFIYSVNKTLFTSLNSIGQVADENKDDIIKLKDAIITLSDNMDIITDTLENIDDGSKDLTNILSAVKGGIPSLDTVIGDVNDANENNTNSINTIKSSLNNSINNINNNLNNAKIDLYRIESMIDYLNLLSKESGYKNVDYTVSKINYQIDLLDNKINVTRNFLDKINSFKSTSAVENMIDSLDNIQNSLDTEKRNINELQDELDKGIGKNSNLMTSITSTMKDINDDLIDASVQYNNEVIGDLNSIADELVDSTNTAVTMLQSIENLNNSGDSSIDALIEGSNLAGESASKLNKKLLKFKDDINKLANELKLVNNNDIIQIITILQNNPEFMGNFMSNPFNVKVENIYTVGSFGSAMAPLYTTLANWVGSILLVSIFRSDADGFKGDEEFTPRERYLGKLTTFVMLSLIQGFIVAVGDKLLVNVQTVNVFLMIMISLAASATFTTITYTLVSMFGNLGKAISIIFLIAQIAGSGATYPIQLEPLIFRVLQPIFPFTYVVSGFREAIAGPLISTVVLDFVVLIITTVIFIIMGLFLKKRIYHITYKFRKKLKDSGIGY